MSDWKKKLADSRYSLPGNGYVVDDKDAVEAATMAYHKGIDDAYLILAMDLDKEYIQGNLMSNISRILNKLKQ